MISNLLSYLFAAILGWITGGILGIPLGTLARWSTRKYWPLWVVAIFFLSPLSIKLLDAANIDNRFAVPGYAFLTAESDKCMPTDDAFFAQIKDPQKLSSFVEANKWKKSCAEDNSFRLLEALDLTIKNDLDRGLPMLGQLLKDNPSDPTVQNIVKSLEEKGLKIPR
jgi:hypothetical protein